MARDIRVAFKLAEDKKELLQQYAKDYGVTMSALCAFVIGQWLHNQEQEKAARVSEKAQKRA